VADDEKNETTEEPEVSDTTEPVAEEETPAEVSDTPAPKWKRRPRSSGVDAEEVSDTC
jgi:hypothetical protein